MKHLFAIAVVLIRARRGSADGRDGCPRFSQLSRRVLPSSSSSPRISCSLRVAGPLAIRPATNAS